MSSASKFLISIVVIGLNEEAHLETSLTAVMAAKPPECDLEVFYVDSGSSDRSVEIAAGVLGVEVIHLNTARPSAAKARNAGLSRVRGSYVQLVDGDSVVQPGWLSAAVEKLSSTDEIACVFGQCIEMHPEQSIYMRVCGLDWFIAPGDHRLCGGNAMWRTSVISEHGYFDEALQLGEEPDLCYRVRQRGMRIVCIDKPMVLHDLGMTHFKEYWKRGENSGKAYARVALRYWKNAEKLWFQEFLRNFAEPLIWLTVFAVGWWFGGVSGGLLVLLGWWSLRATKIATSIRTRTRTFSEGLVYGFHCQFIRVPMVVGQLKALLHG